MMAMITTPKDTYRLIFLGAGFSFPAGLPLGADLFKEVRRHISSEFGTDNHVERELGRYIQFMRNCFDREIQIDKVDCEEFMGFLDREHFLGLKGSDTWCSEGNESQLMIRDAIARVIHRRTPTEKQIPDAYRRFAAQLDATDYVCTFNYDTLLENALECEGIPYRYFAEYYSDISPFSCTVDPNAPHQVRIIKLHGSVDWFSKKKFDRHKQLILASPHLYPPDYNTRDPIFGDDAICTPIPITSGPRPIDESLQQLFRVRDFYKTTFSLFGSSPYLLSPSTAKLFYAQPLLDLWRGLQRNGDGNLSFAIIGYSLPAYDDYATQVLYSIARNYCSQPNLEYCGRSKTKIRIVDLQTTEEAKAQFRQRYRFLDWSLTEAIFTGFDSSAADWVLR